MSFRWEDFGVCLGKLHAKKKKNGNFDAWKGLEFSHWSHFDLFLVGICYIATHHGQPMVTVLVINEYI